MGAGQIGGIATLLDIDFDNAAGFVGVKAENTEGNFIVYFLSHAMMFCVGALLEAHVVLTPASCVIGERHKFEVFGGSHRFLETAGIPRQVRHYSVHRGYNQSNMWNSCSANNVGLLVLNEQFSFHQREAGSDYVINRIRYGTSETAVNSRVGDTTCKYFGWGSRRNGYLIPLLIDLRRVNVNILPMEKCPAVWRNENKYLCIQQPSCKSEKFGALCPDDMGTVIECSGFIQGMMTSRLVDRPCGVGFLDMALLNKFLTCGVDDSRDVIDHDEYMTVEFHASKPAPTRILATPPVDLTSNDTEETF